MAISTLSIEMRGINDRLLSNIDIEVQLVDGTTKRPAINKEGTEIILPKVLTETTDAQGCASFGLIPNANMTYSSLYSVSIQGKTAYFTMPTNNTDLGSLDLTNADDAPVSTESMLGPNNQAELSAEVITSGVFASDRIPDLDASKIASGSLDVNRIPDLNASKITDGVLDVARIPDLDAGKITSGGLDAARVPDLDAAKISSGLLDAARVPDLPASKVASGQLDKARLPDLSYGDIAPSLTALTDGATISWSTNTAPNAQVTLGGNRTMGAPSGGVNGGYYILNVKQDSTGSREITWNSVFNFDGIGGAPTLTTDADKTDKLVFAYEDSKFKCIGIVQGI